MTMFESPEMLVLAFGLPGNMEWIVLLVLGLLIFGRRLPEVGRSIGQSIVEFKRGIKGIQNDIDEESTQPASKAKPESLENKSSEYQPLPSESIGGAAPAEVKAPEKASPSTEG